MKNYIQRIRAVRAVLCGSALACGALANVPDAMAAERTFGFAVVEIYHEMVEDNPDACPEGMNKPPTELYLATLDDDKERQRLSRAENARELYYGKSSLNDSGIPTCLDPEGPLPAAMKPELKVVAGNGPAFGIDLDGSHNNAIETIKTCPHQHFHGMDGQPGVDNQFYRVAGCISGFRSDGMLAQHTYGSDIRNGSWAVVFEIGDVESLEQDDSVSVSIYSSRDPAPFSGSGVPLSYQSLSINSNERFHAHTTGRIRNGVLISDPVDVRFLVSPESQSEEGRTESTSGVQREVYLRGARLRLKLSPDGSAAKGVLAGYHDIESFDHNFIRYHGHEGFATGAAVTLGYSCASLHTALEQYADGFPDPRTGRCTAISTAFTIKAVPAFIVKD